ncbi:unnamed protein product [Cunninghamella echinulata]
MIAFNNNNLFFIIIIISLFYNIIICQIETNPVFWQLPTLYNLSDSFQTHSTTNIPSLNNSRLAMSQQFQTVVNTQIDILHPYKRIIIDMSNGCTNDTKIIKKWITLPFNTSTLFTNLPKMALVERGACQWYEKIETICQLSNHYRLNIDAIMIYDNYTTSFNNKNKNKNNNSFQLQPTTETIDTIHYSTPLPSSQNINYMKDNNLNQSIIYQLPVYFVSNDYGQYLKSSLSSLSFNLSADLYPFFQVVPFFSDMSPPPQPNDLDDNNNEDNTDNDGSSSSSSFSSLLESSKGYFSYVVVLVVLFMLAAIVLRWWRVKRLQQQIEHREQIDVTFMMTTTRADQIDPLPVEMVNKLPVTTYQSENVKNGNCAVCLDDFIENKSELRLLPCHHGFCPLCIDPWLTQKSSLCPICKYDCLPNEIRNQRNEEQSNSHYNNDSTINNDNINNTDQHPIYNISQLSSSLQQSTSVTPLSSSTESINHSHHSSSTVNNYSNNTITTNNHNNNSTATNNNDNNNNNNSSNNNNNNSNNNMCTINMHLSTVASENEETRTHTSSPAPPSSSPPNSHS